MHRASETLSVSADLISPTAECGKLDLTTFEYWPCSIIIFNDNNTLFI